MEIGKAKTGRGLTVWVGAGTLAACGLLLACAPAKPPASLPSAPPPLAQPPPPPVAPPSCLRPASWADLGPVEDDLAFRGLAEACRASAAYYAELPADAPLAFGERSVTASEMAGALQALAALAADPAVPAAEKSARVAERFDLYQSPGDDGQGHVLFTGYYEPVLRARTRPDDRYRYPLYRHPSDLVEQAPEGAAPAGAAAPRCVGRLVDGRLVPYYTREEIDTQGVLAGRGLELLWLDDPVDRFFLQVQGSGRVVLEDGTAVRVLYDGKNGQPYRSLGKHLVGAGKLTPETVSLEGIRRYFAGHPEEVGAALAVNPSYTFFRLGDGGPYGNIRVPLTPNRSIATDAALFPKGAPALICTEKPRFDAAGNVAGYDPFWRFVVNQDTGGAIAGPGRVDLFFGPGAQAGLMAGQMQQGGRLYFLAPRK